VSGGGYIEGIMSVRNMSRRGIGKGRRVERILNLCGIERGRLEEDFHLSETRIVQELTELQVFEWSRHLEAENKENLYVD